MYYFIQKFHSGWAYLAILLLVIAVLNSFIGKSSKREFSVKDRKIALFALIGAHIQLLVGLVIYFLSPYGLDGLGQMNIEIYELTSLVHPLISIIAITFITVGWSKHKKADSSIAKFESIILFYGLGLILILSWIPWSLLF